MDKLGKLRQAKEIIEELMNSFPDDIGLQLILLDLNQAINIRIVAERTLNSKDGIKPDSDWGISDLYHR